MKHLSADQVEKFRANALNTQEFFDIDDHLAKCEQCRIQLSRGGEVESLKKQLKGDFVDDIDHLKFEEMASYVDGILDSSAQSSIAEHLESCEICRGEVEDLRAFRNSMVGSPQSDSEKAIPFQKKTSARFWNSAVAALFAAITIAAIIFYRNRIEVLESKLKEVESENARLQHEVANGSVKQPSVIFRDGSSEIRIEKDGHVTASLSIPQNDQEAIRRTVEDQKFDVPPQVLKMIGSKEVLMGTSDELPFSLISPVGTAVSTDRPIFRWQALSNANSYQVRVFNSNFQPVTESSWIRQTEWTPIQPLPAATLTWQVAAKKQNEEIISPYAPFPDAKFLVLSPKEIVKIQEMQRKYSGFHLILGVQYARLGLLDDSEKEFILLEQSNPQSVKAATLLKNIKDLRSLKRKR
jgi:hypothetical protein